MGFLSYGGRSDLWYRIMPYSWKLNTPLSNLKPVGLSGCAGSGNYGAGEVD